MTEGCRIGVIGDYQPGNPTHDTIATSVSHHDPRVEVTWVPTDTITPNASGILDLFDGLWVAPGSPYRSLDGALAAIEAARVNAMPLLGTCGGFQHVVLEFARNVLGVADAHHAEYDPYASTLFITPLSCSLVGTTMEVVLQGGSRAAQAYGADHALERYYCNFGLNPEHRHKLVSAGLTITACDRDGEPRVVELADHPFFIATLYVPQMSSTPASPHPLIGAFVQAAQRRSGDSTRSER